MSEEKKLESVQAQEPSAPQSTVQITGITTGANQPAVVPGQDNQPFKPQRAGSMFARFIDDIFQVNQYCVWKRLYYFVNKIILM